STPSSAARWRLLIALGTLPRAGRPVFTRLSGGTARTAAARPGRARRSAAERPAGGSADGPAGADSCPAGAAAGGGTCRACAESPAYSGCGRPPLVLPPRSRPALLLAPSRRGGAVGRVPVALVAIALARRAGREEAPRHQPQ